MSLKKIVIIGPESTGKSTLCEKLAAYFGTLLCPEYARQFLTENGTDYTYDDLLVIAKGQVAMEDHYTDMSRAAMLAGHTTTKEKSYPLFIDTDMYVMKVWCEFVFGKCHDYILKMISERRYDLYLLCNIDLPWTYDPLREYPDDKPRIALYNIYKSILEGQQTPWVDISGSYEERLERAIVAVRHLCY